MKISVFGDSHAVYFGLTEQVKSYSVHNFANIDFDVNVYQGGTIGGFGKRNSTLGINEKIIEKLSEFNPDYICFAFGQVDLELGYYYKKYVKGEIISFKEWVCEIVASYFEFIAKFDYPVIIKGMNPPAIIASRGKALNYTKRIISENVKDNDEAERISQTLKENFPTDIERVMMSNYFNEVLKSYSEKENVTYFDICDYLTDSNGMLDVKYIPAKFDHHLTDSVHVRVLHVNAMLSSIQKIRNI